MNYPVMTTGIWITRLLTYLQKRFLNRPLIVGLVTVGAVPVFLTILFFGLTWPETTVSFAIVHVFAMLVPVIGAPAIWYWERRVFTRFVDETEEIVKDRNEFRKLTTAYSQRFRKRYWTITVPWMALVLVLVGINIDFFQTIGIDGYTDPAFWLYLVFAAWFGLITGIGFYGALVTVLCIRRIGQLSFVIDPLHPDGLGGLSSIGSFAIWTTMLISLGSLTLPLAFLLGAEGGFTILVYVAVFFYVATILGSFVYPTVYINRKAQGIRARELEDRREQIRDLQRETEEVIEESSEEKALRETTKRLEIQRLRDEYDEYQTVNLYPLSVGVLARLVSSVLLPVAFVLLRVYLNSGSA